MRVCVFGLWHLGVVSAACLADAGHDVTAIDLDGEVVSNLARGIPPLFEPGLAELVARGLADSRLRVTGDLGAVRGAELVWVTYDTPVDEHNRGDVDYVVGRVAALLPFVSDDTMILLSSQLPVGTTRQLEDMARGRPLRLAYSPENLRLGTAIKVFQHPDRVVAGVREEADREPIRTLFAPFTDRIEWMSVESAEMTKHALNAFLASSVTFINEIATVCEQVGADAGEVERGLKSDQRIGRSAYLAPGSSIAGGTLARDVMFLSELASQHRLSTPLLSAIAPSNDRHRQWAMNRLTQILGDVAGKTIAVWGLTYKPGTNTLRSSDAVTLCLDLRARGAAIRAHDPAVGSLPAELSGTIELCDTPAAATVSASALVVSTPWPEFRQVPADVLGNMQRRVVVDANRFLADTVGRAEGVEYFSVGKTQR